MSIQVPAAPARTHVRGLLDQGMTQAAICRAAGVTSSYLSALLYGQYVPGRPPQLTTDTRVADRLLAVEYVPPSRSASCSPGGRFEPVGYRIGRCGDCGQYAPVHTRNGAVVMMSHPRPEPEAQAPDALPPAADQAHPDCGSPRGAERHKREHTEACEPCRAARRGYEQGMTAGLAKAARMAKVTAPLVSPELTTEVVSAMRAVLHRRPYPQLRELARTVVRAAADAEFAVDDEAAA